MRIRGARGSSSCAKAAETVRQRRQGHKRLGSEVSQRIQLLNAGSESSLFALRLKVLRTHVFWFHCAYDHAIFGFTPSLSAPASGATALGKRPVWTFKVRLRFSLDAKPQGRRQLMMLICACFASQLPSVAQLPVRGM